MSRPAHARPARGQTRRRAGRAGAWSRLPWPRSLGGRLVLLLALTLLLTQALTLAVVLGERGQVMRGVMQAYVVADVASSVAMLERLPPAERAAWLPRLQRDHYRLVLPEGPATAAGTSAPAGNWADPLAQALSQALRQPVAVQADGPRQGETPMRLSLLLQDGTPLHVALRAPSLRLSPWLGAALGAQWLLLAGLAAWAVRQATRPLAQLAAAAQAWSPEAGTPSAHGPASPPLPQDGPSEVAVAARAFERMQQRIASHLAERNEVLGAISHDLQTPITRMRLRAELLDDATLRDKLQSDLGQMQHLVAQGLALARAGHAQHEARVRTDLLALLHSLVGDAQDAGQAVRWLIEPERGCTVVTRPQALRRVLGNLLDNACKFGGEAELMLVHPSQPGQPGRASADAQATLPSVQVRVLDRGPGIAPSELERVLKPFYRSEASRNPATGGAGLGLAIVQRLLPACGATLHLAPREGGGLVATVSLPLA